jgi:hypothetical protein
MSFRESLNKPVLSEKQQANRNNKEYNEKAAEDENTT